MTNGKCREHHYWDPSPQNSRCKGCSIQREYFDRHMAALNSWPVEDKKGKEWQRLVDNLKCKPHTHEVVNTTCNDREDKA